MRFLRAARECIVGVEVGTQPEGRPGARPTQDPDSEEAVAEFAEYFGRTKKYPLCLVGDALYGCDPVWRICEKYGWKYITTFKEGRTPDLYANVGLRFKVGLKHRFVNGTEANRVWYCLMMMAWTIWQMFQRGFLLRLEVGCRKMTQLLWCEMIRTYIRNFGCVMLEPRYRMMSRKNL